MTLLVGMLCHRLSILYNTVDSVANATNTIGDGLEVLDGLFKTFS